MKRGGSHLSLSLDRKNERKKKRRTTPFIFSTVRLLEARARSGSAELLRLAAPRVGHQQRPVVRKEQVLHLLLGGLVDVLLEERDDPLGHRLADGVRLRDVAAAGDADADVDEAEAGGAQEEEGLHDLGAEGVGLDEVDGGA